jgi:hypothetical protein
MPTYLVRTIKHLDLVGVFYARDTDELALIVDECTDPGSCEYQRMKTGGIMWTSPAIPVPIETPEDADGTEDDPIPWSGASLTESWFDSFYGYAKGKWKLLVPDGGEPFFPEPPVLPQLPGPGHVVPFRKRRGS